MALRWVILAVAVLASGPAGLWLRRRPALRLQLCTVLGMLPFLPVFRLALLLFATAPSDTHGFETIPLFDGLVLVLLRSTRRRQQPFPYRFALTFYLLVVGVSIFQARWPQLVFGYAWTLGRMVLLVVTIWRLGGEDERVIPALVRGWSLGAVFEAGLCTWQHFGQGLTRTAGSFSGWNDVGMAMNLVVMVPVARILAGPTSLLTKLVPVAALLGALFSVSRGALLFLGMGIGLVWFGSMVRQATARKTWFGLCGLLLAAAVVPIALTTVESRDTAEKQQSMETRELLKDAAAMMLQEHPLGVGASHFTSELLLGGYGRRARLSWAEWITIVHNVYWLTAAELGYAGVLALLVLFLTPLYLAFVRRPRGPRGDVLLGLGVGLLFFCLHGFFEWAWRLSELSYLYFMSIAMVAVLARPPRRRPATPLRRAGPRRVPERIPGDAAPASA